jgi:Gram-negative bacterial TonB protein C-terminal
MFRLDAICVLVALTLSVSSPAQSDPQQLEQALKGKQLALRSYSADPVGRYTWRGGKLIEQPAQVHTLGLLDVSSVSLKNGKLMIKGSRLTLITDKKQGKLGVSGKSPMTLEIDLHGTDPAEVIPGLTPALFFPDAQAAIAGLPTHVTLFDVSRQGTASCHCYSFFDHGSWIEMPDSGSKLTQPRIIKQTMPEASGNGQGSTAMSLFVSSSGAVEDLWLTLSANPELDKATEDAMRQYKFAPAQYDGRAVGVRVAIETNVQEHL